MNITGVDEKYYDFINETIRQVLNFCSQTSGLKLGHLELVQPKVSTEMKGSKLIKAKHLPQGAIEKEI